MLVSMGLKEISIISVLLTNLPVGGAIATLLFIFRTPEPEPTVVKSLGFMLITPRSRHVPKGATVRRHPVRVEQLSHYRLLNWCMSHDYSISGLGAPPGRRGHGAIRHTDASHRLVSRKN